MEAGRNWLDNKGKNPETRNQKIGSRKPATENQRPKTSDRKPATGNQQAKREAGFALWSDARFRAFFITRFVICLATRLALRFASQASAMHQPRHPLQIADQLTQLAGAGQYPLAVMQQKQRPALAFATALFNDQKRRFMGVSENREQGCTGQVVQRIVPPFGTGHPC